MRNWVKWCIEHNLSLVPYVVLFLLILVYLLYGMVEGVKEGVKEWAKEWAGDLRWLNKKVSDNRTNKEHGK